MSTLPPFVINIAGLRIRIVPQHSFVRRLCEDYIVAETGVLLRAEGDFDLDVGVTSSDIEEERARATTDDEWSDAYLETLAVLRRIAEWAPVHDRMLMHGAVVAYGGRAYMFCAPSGTGKSTHIRLWREQLGDAATVINGDKPFVVVPEQGVPHAYGTPWAGKEGWQTNASAPLAGICLLSRGASHANSIERIKPERAIERMLRQSYLPEEPEAAARTLTLLDRLLTRVPLYDFTCDVSSEAVRVSFEALTGERFPHV